MTIDEKLELQIAHWKQTGKIEIDARKHPAVQDMLGIMMNADKVTCPTAASSVVNKERYNNIAETQWGVIAVDLWGHGDPHREWNKLENPVFEMPVTEEQVDLMAEVLRYSIEDTKHPFAVDALALFLVFEMQHRGYHI